MHFGFQLPSAFSDELTASPCSHSSTSHLSLIAPMSTCVSSTSIAKDRPLSSWRFLLDRRSFPPNLWKSLFTLLQILFFPSQLESTRSEVERHCCSFEHFESLGSESIPHCKNHSRRSQDKVCSALLTRVSVHVRNSRTLDRQMRPEFSVDTQYSHRKYMVLETHCLTVSFRTFGFLLYSSK